MREVTILIIGIVFLLFGNLSYGQLSTNEKPYSFSYDNLKWENNQVVLPKIDLEEISKEDSIDEENGNPPRFGYPHKVDLNLDNSGEWLSLPNGDKLWRLEICCPSAKSINLLYDKFWLPDDAKMFVYSRDKKQILGAFTSRNNKGSSSEPRGFATGLVYSDSIVIEYYVPHYIQNIGFISIAYVIQGYRFFGVETGNLGRSGACQVNINCLEGQGWQKEKNAVAAIIIDGRYLCTGSLVNTTSKDNRPFFLTADHCLNGHDALNNENCDYWTFYWNYESPDCNNPINEPEHYTTNGAVVLANNSISDFALLYLNEDPRDNSCIKKYYLGWDNFGNSGTSVIGIHHPKGDIKKIATKNTAPTTSGNFWSLYWDQTTNGYSVTEGGSSGSPLINNDRHLIGQLYGGSSLNCTNPSMDYALYGKFSQSWTSNDTADNHRKLKPWLDSLNTGNTVIDGVGLIIDLFIRDSVTDNGTMPSNVAFNWDSPDIWLEDLSGNRVENPTGNTYYNVCVRIHNRSDYPSTGDERLFLNWAKAGINDYWYENWTSYNPLICDQHTAYKGGAIDSPNGIPLSSIPAHSSKIEKVQWRTPLWEYYVNCSNFTDDPWHFCLLARVHDGDTIAHENEQQTGVYWLVRDHNNVAQKNVYLNKGASHKSVISISNPTANSTTRFLRLLKRQNIFEEKITDFAEVSLTLDADLISAINHDLLTGAKFVNDNTLLITDDDFMLPLQLTAGQYSTLSTSVNFLTNKTPQNDTTHFDIVAYTDDNFSEIAGGQGFKNVYTAGRTFYANAGNDTSVLLNTTAILHATQINENATYRWYDKNRNFLYEGVNFSVIPLHTSEYILEVTAGSDGYRDLDTVKVNVVPGCIRSITPNPVGGNWVVVSYEYAATVTSAQLLVYNTVTATLVGNYDLSNMDNVSSLDIEVTNYPTGSYTEVLVCDNAVCHSKILIRQ